jgi:hypothetical protein
MSETSETLPYNYYALVVDGEIASNFKVPVAMEDVVAAMSSDPVLTLYGETESSCEYSLVVNGELATKIQWSKADPMVNAIFQSNPTVIQLTDEQLEIGVGSGWFWNGTEFTETPQ